MEYKQITARIKKNTAENLANFCKRNGVKKWVFLDDAINNEINKNDMTKKEFEKIVEVANATTQSPVKTTIQEQEQKTTETTAQDQEQKPKVEEVKKEDVEREFLGLAKAIRAEKDKNILLEAKLNAATKELLEQKVLIDNSLQLSEEAKKILDVVSQRLVEMTGNKKITKNKIVDFMVLRYNIEHYTSWFHPFVIKNDEIETITGKPRSEWLEYFERDNE